MNKLLKDIKNLSNSNLNNAKKLLKLTETNLNNAKLLLMINNESEK